MHAPEVLKGTDPLDRKSMTAIVDSWGQKRPMLMLTIISTNYEFSNKMYENLDSLFAHATRISGSALQFGRAPGHQTDRAGTFIVRMTTA